MADIAKVKRNIKKMIDQGAPESDIDAYVASEGTTPEELQATSGERQWSDVPAEAAQNFGSSALRAGGNLVQQLNPMTWPGQASAMINTAAGAMAHIPGVNEFNDWAENAGLAAPRDKEAEQQNMQMATGVKDYWVDRAGSVDAIKNTLATDPAGAMLDVGALAMGGAGVIGRGPMAVNKALNTTRIPGQTRASESLLRWSAPKPGSLDKLGDEAMLLDASPSLTGMAQGVVAKPGPYSDRLVDALTTRHEGRSDRLLHGTQNTLGRLRDPVRLKTGIDKATKRAAGPFYRWAKANAPDLTGQLDNMLARELTTPASGMAPDGRTVMFKVMDEIDDALMAGDPRLTAQRLHDIRKNLDARIVYGEQAVQALSSADKAAQGPLKKARKAVDKILKENMPGFKEGDAITATGKKAQSDVDFGYNALEGGKSAMFPETFAMEYAKRDPKWVKEGVKSRIANALGTKANDTSALKQVVGDGNDFNRKKLVKVLGQDKTNELVQAVDREQLFGQNFADVARNSQTAKRQAALKAIEGPDAPYIDQGATVTGLAARGVSKGLNALLARGLSKYSSKNSEALARALSLKGKAARDFADELAKSKTPGDARRKIIKALVAVQAAEAVNRPNR